jgi:nucleotide-binding universal stress UspA family protein
MFNNILVPLDGTPASNAALPLVKTLARATGGAVTLLRVSLPGEAAPDLAARLERIREGLASSDIQVHAVVRSGDPADEILAEIRARGADLLVMRTHGRAGIGRAILGSVTERVVTDGGVPVVLMRAGERRITQLRTLLVPLDGSPGGVVALGTAIGLARTTGAAVRLLQVVVPIPNYLYGGAAWNSGALIDPTWDDEALAAARSYLTGVAGRMEGLEVTHEVLVAPSVAAAIVKTAEARSADLIVMSTQALTGAARALLGSVTDAVVRSAHCPVLAIHATQPVPPIS